MNHITRRDLMIKTSMGIAGAILPDALAFASETVPANSAPTTKPMNVLFLIVDDLRPQMTCYGAKNMATPNIDKLASSSVMFRSNYCQQAVCSPSRTSLLTGCRPDTTKVYDLKKFFRTSLPDVITLPQQFKNNGYFAEAVGKVFHEDLNDPASWSIPADFDTSVEELEQYQSPESYRDEAERGDQIPKHGLVYGPAVEAKDVPDDNYLDGRIAVEAIRRLKIQGAKKSDTPFFLAVGFHKPHLPFVAPKKYWDLYDPNKIELPSYREKAKDATDLGMTNFDELRQYYGVPYDKAPLPDSMCRELIHGYYAGVSFTDAQIGRVLAALEEQGFASNTIVILCADHGWHLDDHGLWCKHTNFEHATHVPLMIHSPGIPSGVCDSLTENVDIYPTLCDLAGVPKPDSLEGSSLAPLVHDPSRGWKKASFSQYPRGKDIMGYTMRTERYRYTRWMRRKDHATPWIDSSGQTVVAEELYDYQSDPEESTNWAADAGHADILRSLREQSVAGWRAAAGLRLDSGSAPFTKHPTLLPRFNTGNDMPMKRISIFHSTLRSSRLPVRSLAIAAVLSISLAAGAQGAHTTHAQAVARAKAIVAKMTLDEKISELHGVREASPRYRMVPGVPRLGIPDLNMTAGPAGVGPGGARPQQEATAMPAPIALAATWDPELAQEFGKVVGEETRSLGRNLVEGPDVNIARVPQGGRVFESFGEDPYLDGRIVVGEIEGLQSTGIMANVKHFLANNQEADRHTVNEEIGERTLREIYMPAFEASIKDAHSASLMCAYPKVNGVFNCENEPLLNGVLKKEWGFNGFVLSDFNATHSTVASALNGLDLEMPTGVYWGDKLREAVQSGQVPVSIIDDKLVRRFAKMIEFGDFGPQPKAQPIPAFEHGAVARTIAAQGMVLLKNDGGLLPLHRQGLHDALVIGPYAVRPNTGGAGSSQVIPLYAITPYDGLRAWVNTHHDVTVLDGSDINAAVEAAKRAQVAIVMVGDEDSEGRDQSLELPAAQNELITAVAKANPKTIVVIKSGSAVLMPWIDSVAAVLEAWYPGEEDGNAVADVLTGNVNPSGKLPITFPHDVDQTLARNPAQYPGVDGTVHYSEGLDVGYRAYAANNVKPLFPFGFGLSYTTFSFDGLKVTHAPGSHDATVSFRVTNTGKVPGAEVAQLYLDFPPIAEGNEPPIQLKAFSKVMLNPGESKSVELKLDARSFSYWSLKSHAWTIAPGAFQVMVGDSSANTPLTSALTIQ